MKKLFALFLLVLVSSIVLISSTSVQADNGEIALKHLSGEVQYKSTSWLFFSSRWKDLKGRASLSKGDIIKTGPRAKLN